MNILALVVLYKLTPSKSDTLRCLAAQCPETGLDVLVWDNSPAQADTEELQWLRAQLNNSSYRQDGRNTSLADLYNEVIKTQLRDAIKKYDYLVLFDQDSILEPDYLIKMTAAATHHPEVVLLLPSVRTTVENQLISPANLYYFKGTLWKQQRVGLVKARFTTAINSGMMISARYLADVFPGYPPEIPFYGTDNWLCQSVARKYRWLCVVDTTIKHDLAQFGPEPVEIKLWRHRQNIRAQRFMNKTGFVRRSFCHVYTTLISVRLAIRYRDRRFFRP